MSNPFPRLLQITRLAALFTISTGSSLGNETLTLEFQNGSANGYSGCEDICIRHDNPDFHFFGWPLGVDLGGGNDAQIQSLVKFNDIFGNTAARIPLGSNIVSAKLRVYSGNPGNAPRFHRALRSWSKPSATWNSPFLSNNATAGIQGDDIECTSQFLSFGAGNIPTGFHDFEITSFVQQWSNGTPNHGIAWLAGGYDAYTVYPSETEQLNQRPKLIVSFTAPLTGDVLLHEAVELNFATEQGTLYQIQVSDDIASWADLGTSILGDGNRHSMFERKFGSRRFFRVHAVPVSN